MERSTTALVACYLRELVLGSVGPCTPLPRSFFRRPALLLTRTLLNYLLVGRARRNVTSNCVIRARTCVNPRSETTRDFKGEEAGQARVVFGRPKFICACIVRARYLIGIIDNPGRGPRTMLVEKVRPMSNLSLVGGEQGVSSLGGLAGKPNGLAGTLGVAVSSCKQHFADPPLVVTGKVPPKGIAHKGQVKVSGSNSTQGCP